jgi:hypothetical protein
MIGLMPNVPNEVMYNNNEPSSRLSEAKPRQTMLVYCVRISKENKARSGLNVAHGI